MLKSSFILVALLLQTFLNRPSLQHHPKLLISAWENDYLDSKVVERKLAAAPNGQCLKDIFSVDLLKAEVLEIEKTYSGAKVRGKWKHLDLSELPVPQANFLKRYGDKIGDLSGKAPVDYSGCIDVPCIFNKIYQKENNVAGYVHYLWYLKFGHMLSADNLVPDPPLRPGQTLVTNPPHVAGVYQKKDQTLDKFLYSHDELYGLWRLSLMLKSTHSKITNLKEIQRIPRGESIEGKEAYACGVASGAGDIILQDGCLTIYSGKDTGHLYGAVAHELNHMLDMNLGYYSEQPPYMKLSGFSYVDALNDKREMVRTWKRDQTVKAMTKYARTSTMENFAETLAYHRTNGEEMKDNISDELRKHVAINFYHGKNFDRKSLIKEWLASHSLDISKESLKAVVECTSPNAEVFDSSFFTSTDFAIKLLPSMLSCLGFKGEELSRQIASRISIQEPDGCENLKYNGNKDWLNSSRKEIAQYYSRFLEELAQDKDYVARINTFYAELSNKDSARLAFLNCYDEADEEDCYIEDVNKLTLEKAKSLRLPDSHTAELVSMYESFHPYVRVQEETSTFYLNFTQTHRASIKKDADKLFKQCLDLPLNDDVPPRNVLFQMGNGYLISSVYNCLDEKIPETIRLLIKNMAVGEVKLEHPKEEIILYKEIKPLLTSELETIYELNTTLESERAKNEAQSIVVSVRKSLLSDFSWVSDILNSKKILTDCHKEAMVRITFKPVYHLKKDLFSDLAGKEMCQEIESTPEYIKYLEDSKSSLIQKSQESLENKLQEEANKQAARCVTKFPVDTNLNRVKFKREREACLVNQWPKLEEEILKSFSQDPLVKKFNLSPEMMKTKFDQNRRRNQLKIFKDVFKS